MTEWLSIDTAPKDGTMFLAIEDENEYSFGVWNELNNEWYPPDLTHWTPLPEIPKESNENKD